MIKNNLPKGSIAEVAFNRASSKLSFEKRQKENQRKLNAANAYIQKTGELPPNIADSFCKPV